MVSILKTLQSLFFLGKKIQYLKHDRADDQQLNLNVTYSWAKSFKLIQEHRILSLAAFKPPKAVFMSEAERIEASFLPASPMFPKL